MDDTKINIPPVHNYTRQLTTFEKIKDVVSSMALISGVAYGIYIFYKVIWTLNIKIFYQFNFFFRRNTLSHFFLDERRKVIILMS